MAQKKTSLRIKSDLIKQLIKEQGTSQRKIAELLNVDYNTVYRWLLWKDCKTINNLLLLADCLNVHPSYISDESIEDIITMFESNMTDEADFLSDYINGFIKLSNKKQNKSVTLTPEQHIAVSYYLSKYTTDVINTALECPDDLNPMEYISKHLVVKKK